MKNDRCGCKVVKEDKKAKNDHLFRNKISAEG